MSANRALVLTDDEGDSVVVEQFTSGHPFARIVIENGYRSSAGLGRDEARRMRDFLDEVLA